MGVCVSRVRVDPRGCGGASRRMTDRRTALGRSPRVRGSPSGQNFPCLGVGSIPAGAGEPRRQRPQPAAPRVDPRGCGGAMRTITTANGGEGRSPRVRGSRWSNRRSPPRSGSIPAGAGEPSARRRRGSPKRVDPRGCGGAGRRGSRSCGIGGRSPRVRGSRLGVRPGEGQGGSIPAGAGEPRGLRWGGSRGWVDPRGCGGADRKTTKLPLMQGRSPRVRGSLLGRSRGVVDVGSIPAGAGEPAWPLEVASRRGVDPRGCGGAACRSAAPGLTAGRSPRVRGSHDDGGNTANIYGSIPAGAGEPSVEVGQGQGGGVDPRGCGGAGWHDRSASASPGRSPRVRGSLYSVFSRNRHVGSIPAGAGEPQIRCKQRQPLGVDPRGCGGAANRAVSNSAD